MVKFATADSDGQHHVSLGLGRHNGEPTTALPASEVEIPGIRTRHAMIPMAMGILLLLHARHVIMLKHLNRHWRVTLKFETEMPALVVGGESGKLVGGSKGLFLSRSRPHGSWPHMTSICTVPTYSAHGKHCILRRPPIMSARFHAVSASDSQLRPRTPCIASPSVASRHQIPQHHTVSACSSTAPCRR